MKALLKLFLITLIIAPQLTQAISDEDGTNAQVAKSIADRLPKIHLNRLKFDDNIATNALDVFISSLDYRHSYFLQSDIDAFQEKAIQMDDWLKDGQVQFAQEIYDTFLDRVSNRVAYVDTLLETGFDTTLDETAPLGVNVHRWSYYTRAKVIAEQNLWQMHRNENFPLTVIRPSWIFGPRDRTSIARLHRMITTGKIKILGPGVKIVVDLQ